MGVSVKVWGEFALFTRPELKVERVSYPMMTPSAARGVLDAILYKPQMRWHVRRITALRPVLPKGFPQKERDAHYRLIQIRRNEVAGKIPTTKAERWVADATGWEPYRVDENRTQRNSLVLHHVAYLIEASPKLTHRANQPRTKPEDEEDHGRDTEIKYVSMFNRRVLNGQCFHRPYLGCREFACQFGPPSEADGPLTDWNADLGLMLYDIRFREPTPGVFVPDRPGFFMASVQRGVLHCDTENQGAGFPPPIHILGWDDEGGAK